MTIGERINKARLKHGMTMSELARRSGFSQSGLSSIEINSRSPSVENLENIVVALGMTMPEFFSDEPPAQSPELRELIRLAEQLPPEKINVLSVVAKSLLE